MEKEPNTDGKSKTKNKDKEVKLRIYEFVNGSLTKQSNEIVDILNKKLNATSALSRMMQVNLYDGDLDVIIYFVPVKTAKALKCIMLRLLPSEESHTITNEILNRKTIPLEELQSSNVESGFVQKECSYFYITDKYVVASRNNSIKMLQTYLNWVLEEERGKYQYELKPILTLPTEFKIKDIKSIVIGDLFNIENKSKDENEVNRRTLSMRDLFKLRNIISDNSIFEDLETKKILKAEILIKFVKPKGMNREEFNKNMAAIIKPMNDSDSVSLVTKNNGTIRGSEIERKKTVVIDLTTSRNLNEEQLWQEMEKFIHEMVEQNNI